jgi:molecular chaperone GrpE
MSSTRTEKGPAENGPVHIEDRRRFDADGNARPGVEVEETAETLPEPNPQEAALAALRQELDAARKRVDEFARAYQGLQAEREVFKQRLSRERDQLMDVERGKVARALLEAIDELDLALEAAGDDTAPLARGVRLIRDKLLNQATAQGIERLKLLGKPFDPSLAEAADMEVTDDPRRDQQVIAEVRAGYRLGDRIIRPARVRVAKYVQPARA